MRIPPFALGVLLLCSLTVGASASSDDGIPLQAKPASPEGGKKKKALTDRQIKKILIDESIAAYSGNCPCPYNTARNGSRCGRRSAYDRAGGEAPLCFERDVSAEMVQQYRDAHRED